jgi:hypothetical protein
MSQLCIRCPADAKQFARYGGWCNLCYGRSAKAVPRGLTTLASLE